MSTTEQTDETRWPVPAIAEPLSIIANPSEAENLIVVVTKAVDEFEADISTEKGRKDVASFAYKITRTKTAIDAAGKEHNAHLREQIEKTDSVRRDLRSKLDALKDRARAPLTEWEKAEEQREALAQQIIDRITEAATITAHDTSATIGDKIERLEALTEELTESILQDRLVEATDLLSQSDKRLAEEFARLKKLEAEHAELQRLREEKEQREAAEREAEERVIAEEKERVEREHARLEEERLQKEKNDAAEKARIEERERIEREERERKERDAELKRQREADQENRERVLMEIANDLRENVRLKNGVRISQSVAENIAESLAAGEISHVTVDF